MSRTSTSYRRNSPEAAAGVIAALIVQDGRLDWREMEFLDGAGMLQMLGIGRERFMVVLARCLGERLGGMAAGRSAGAGQFDAALDAIDDHATQLIVAAALLYLTGGIINPFSLLLIGPAVLAAATLPARQVVSLAVLAIAACVFLAITSLMAWRPLTSPLP